MHKVLHRHTHTHTHTHRAVFSTWTTNEVDKTDNGENTNLVACHELWASAPEARTSPSSSSYSLWTHKNELYKLTYINAEIKSLESYYIRPTDNNFACKHAISYIRAYYYYGPAQWDSIVLLACVCRRLSSSVTLPAGGPAAGPRAVGRPTPRRASSVTSR